MASVSENEQFVRDTVGYPLDEAVDWIKGNLTPEEVFTEDQLRWWAEENGFKEEVED